ncbi:MAG: NAD-dependent epimerase/dehydratase family protein [Bacteroidota bacterium]
MRKALVIGSRGQIGIELVEALQRKLGNDNVWGADIHNSADIPDTAGQYAQLNVLDKEAMRILIEKNKITEVYQLAALLSATGEKNPMYAWKLNMEGLLNILEIAQEFKTKLFWPSSIAAFGPTTPSDDTPQRTIMEPTSVYGISKQAGERWCEYYFLKYGVDVRSIRYPGLIGYKSAPGGGTTDYAVDIFYSAIQKGSYDCFLQPHTELPMMMMDDAIRATIELMEAPSEHISIRSAYNLAGVSFTPAQLALEIKKHLPNFEISYYNDFRQQLADSWPNSIDDTQAQKDWNWKINFPLETLVKTMLSEINKKIS